MDHGYWWKPGPVGKVLYISVPPKVRLLLGTYSRAVYAHGGSLNAVVLSLTSNPSQPPTHSQTPHMCIYNIVI
jgi:hypothetical protein